MTDDDTPVPTPPRGLTVAEGNLAILEATIRGLIEESDLLTAEAHASLAQIETIMIRMREKHAQITAVLAKAAERRK
jgi:hypothetical protein